MPSAQGSEETVEVVEQTPEQRAAEEAEGEAAFAAGVANVRGEAPKESDAEGDKGKTTETGDAAVAAKADADKAAADAAAKATADAAAKAAADADPWKGVPQVVRDEFNKLNTSVTTQLRNLAGHIGSFKQQIERISTTAKAAADTGAPAPTKVEIAEAMTDPDKWKQLQEDFPEWMGPVASELTRLRKEMAAVAKSAEAKPAPVAAPAAAAAEPVNTAAIVAEAEERAYVRLKHPDWKAICASPAFATDWLPKQTEEIKAKAASDAADDAIAVFDAYKAHQKKLADEAAAKVRNEKRLQAAVPAQGSAEPPKQGLDDDEAFNAGVKRTLKKG
jgi:hypothetical protein